LARKAAASDDNDEGTSADDVNEQQQRGWLTKASKRVQKLVAGSGGRYRDVVSMGGGSPIAGVLTDAAAGAAELAAEEVRTAAMDVLKRNNKNGVGASQKQQLTAASPSTSSSSSSSSQLETQARIEADAEIAMDAISLAKTSVADAFDAAEIALSAAEREITRARTDLENAKRDATLGLAVAEKAAAEAAVKARRVTVSVVREVALAESLKDMKVEAEREIKMEENETEVENVLKEEGVMESKEEDIGEAIPSPEPEPSITAESDEAPEEVEVEAEENANDDKWSDFDISSISYEDVDYTLTDMAPPFINEDECLVPGEPVVRVEKAPQNSRRIFAGIDIPVSVDDVWNLLSDYPNLQKVIPNLVVNEVVEILPGGGNSGQPNIDDESLSATEQCQTLANHMKGAVLRQVGGAKVVGINFSARTKLEVREWPMGMPDFAHFEDEVYEGKSRSARVRESKGRELMRYAFPRPFALSSLPHKDISMQSVMDDDGEFRMYQGVWRMQPLPGCSPEGNSAMRLTYAVEVSPRPYLPVALVEGRIAQDLCANLKAIRDVFAAKAAAAEEDKQ